MISGNFFSKLFLNKKKLVLFFCFLNMYQLVLAIDYWTVRIPGLNIYPDSKNESMVDFVRSGVQFPPERSRKVSNNYRQQQIEKYSNQISKLDYCKKDKSIFSGKGSDDFARKLFVDFKELVTFAEYWELELPFSSFEAYSFFQFNKYQFEGFIAFIKSSPNYAKNIDVLYKNLWKNSDSVANRKKCRGAYGFKRDGFANKIRDLHNEIPISKVNSINREEKPLLFVVGNDDSFGDIEETLEEVYDSDEINLLDSSVVNGEVVENIGTEVANFSSGENFTGNTNISPKYFVNGASGFVQKTAGKVLDFCNTPEVVRAVDNAVQGGVRNVLLDDGLDGVIQEAVHQVVDVFTSKEMASDFKKEHIDPYRTDIVINKPSLIQDNPDFKDIVKDKIIVTKNDLDLFHKECEDLSFSKNANHLERYLKEYFKDTVNVVANGLDLSAEYYDYGKFKTADGFADFSSSLLGVVKYSKSFCKSFVGGFYGNLSKYKNPLNVIKEFGEGLSNVYAGFTKATLKLIELRYLADKNPELCAKKIDRIFEQTARKIGKAKKRYLRLPFEEKVVFLGQTLGNLLGDIVVPVGALKLAKKTKQFFAAIPSIIKKEVAIAKLAKRTMKVGASKFKEVMTPLSNAVMETTECIEIAGTHGLKTTKASLEIVSNNKGLITSEGGLGKAVSKVIKRTKKAKEKFINLASKKRTAHINIGEIIAENEFAGGHKFPGNPGKTAFPKSWSEEKIMHAISDIATDPNLKWIPRGGNGGSLTRALKPVRFIVEGVSDRVKIRVVVESAGEGIITGFPLSGPGVTCRPINI